MTAHRIHVIGASGAGTTTLARALANELGIRSFDADDQQWLEGVEAPVLRIEGDTSTEARVGLVKRAAGLEG